MEDVTVEHVLIAWANRGLAHSRALAEGLLASPWLNPTDRPVFETVTSQPDIKNLTEDLCDGSALCTLFAALRSARDGKPFCREDLWPMDERDTDLRAAHLCTILGSFVPTTRARSLLAPMDIVSANAEPLRAFLACSFLQEPLLPDLPSSLHASEVAAARARLEAVLAKVEEHAGGAATEPPEDPTPLLHGGEDFQVLATTSAEQLLLRWANVQLASAENHRPVENFGSDLEDGTAIGLLLATVAPEVMQLPLASDLEERLDQVAAAATRCTDFELLTVNSILEGQSDMLAAFFAQLFLSRPNLAAKPDSLLAMHLQLLERVCCDGLQALAVREDSARVMRLCVELEAHWGEFTLAAQTIQDASRTMQAVHDRMRAFLGDTLVHRARGQPRTMLDAKEAREFLVYTSLNSDRLLALLTKENMDSSIISRLEDLLRKHFRLLREVFRYYAASSGGSGAGVTLEGLLKLYQDCKLRSKDLAPHHLEVLFCDHMDPGSSSERVLTPQSFVEVLLQCANLRFRSATDHLNEQFAQLVEYHLKPHACQDTDCIFQRMAYDPKVREVLDANSKELKIIFQLYAMLDASSTEALQKVNTMNIKEFHMLLSHCEMLDETLTEAAMQQLFDGIQHNASEEDTGEGLDDDEELAFSEFLDGLVAIAAYKFPDPFKPFHMRVNAFILQLFSTLRRHWSRKRISPQVDSLLNVLQKKLR